MSLVIDNGSWATKCGISNHDKLFVLFSCGFNDDKSFSD